MELTYLGHSAFRVRGRDASVVTDPFPPGPNLQMGRVTADVVTVSHKSPNHQHVEGVGGNPRVVCGPGEYEIADVLIAGVATGMKPGDGAENTAYVLRFDDLAVCHLGDLRSKLTDKQVEEIGNIDVLLVPVGGGGALTATAAAEVVAQLEPSVVIPMHYELSGTHIDGMQPVDHFIREMGSKEFLPESKFSVTKGGLPAEMKVVVLENRRV